LGASLNVKLIRLMSATEESRIVPPVPKLARSMLGMDGGNGETPRFSGETKMEATVILISKIGQE
jgi:hypothetical protein